MVEIFASKTAEIEEREVLHADISRKLAGECMVLLENDGALPIHTKKVALFGNGARATIKGGTGSGDVNTRNNVNIEQGFQNAGIEVTTTAWLDRQEKRTRAAKEAYVQWMKEETARKQYLKKWVALISDMGIILSPVLLCRRKKNKDSSAYGDKDINAI